MRHYLMSQAVASLAPRVHVATLKAVLVAATGGTDLDAPGVG